MDVFRWFHCDHPCPPPRPSRPDLTLKPDPPTPHAASVARVFCCVRLLLAVPTGNTTLWLHPSQPVCSSVNSVVVAQNALCMDL